MTSSKRWVFWSAVAAVLLALHFTIEFAAWASHPGNLAVGRGSAVPWEIASFPLFVLTGQQGGTNFFWEAMVANSLIWSLGLTAVAKRIFASK
jgi:hypothetical protein